jgi:DNA-binding CsgD family transcriptional regulator
MPSVAAALPAEAVLALYDSTLHADAWQRMMAVVARLLGTDKAMLVRLDHVCPSESVTETIGLTPEITAALRQRDLDEDLIWQAVLPLPNGAVFRVSDLVPRTAFAAGPLYHKIAVPAGLEFAAGASLENNHAYFTILCVMRSDRDFTDTDLGLLRALVPDLQNAFRIRQRVALGDAGRREALLSFDRSHQPVVVLDRGGYAIHQNADADRIIESTPGVALRHGRFVFQSLALQAEFEAIMQVALRPESSEPQGTYELRVPRPGSVAPLAFTVVPITRSSDRAVLPDGAACLVMMFDLETPNPLPLSRLAWLYRLTAAEARVCEALFRVGSVDAAAEDLQLSRNTVRSHLKNIYSKFGIATQGQLMQRLGSSLRLVTGLNDRD